ncbi:MAG: cyanophycinase [bacterium]|nr:cyanophycinase [bacterium]
MPGTLIIIGGGPHNFKNRFLKLSGGPEAPIVIIPTAGEEDHYDAHWKGLQSFRDAGAKNVTLCHTRDPQEADSEAFVKPIQQARGVYFSGGRQWRLADAYLNTRTHHELQNLLKRSGVIAGTSAGATIQGSYLIRGDTRGNTLMMGDHEQGFGFLENVAIDQHLLKRNRQFDLVGVIKAHPHLLGIGIDENTAIEVQGDTFEVLGKGYVAIYDSDCTIPPHGPFYFLAPGDRYNLKTREATRPQTTYEALDRIERKKNK